MALFKKINNKVIVSQFGKIVPQSGHNPDIISLTHLFLKAEKQVNMISIIYYETILLCEKLMPLILNDVHNGFSFLIIAVYSKIL